MTPTERSDLVERLLPIAAGLACITHGDGGPDDIAQTLADLDQTERDALIVVLAALVDPDTTITDALGYVTWDEHGRPSAPIRSPETLRDIAVYQHAPSGVHQALQAEQQMTARVLHRQYGHAQTDVARRLGVHERTIHRWVNPAA
ncbi:helix-turn-helix domain-containing protein [Kitasatospora sp. HPMI-4]|uniref:helix-turn-helix domain-containing protein n=1 Tax=Kitasatospora sp. HPMI-4 TaxID=3448443 RepID=UPI003F1CEE18